MVATNSLMAKSIIRRLRLDGIKAIKAPKAWQRWAGILVLVLAIIGTGMYFLSSATTVAKQPPTEISKKANILEVVQAAGVLQPRLKVDVGAQVSGQIRRIHVQLGQSVRKGDLLVSIDPDLAQNDVIQGEGSVAQQVAAIDSRKSDLLLAESELRRQRDLILGEATTKAELERAEVDFSKIKADLRGQEALLKILQASLDRKRLALGYTSIAAPIDGIVVNIAVQEGQTVSASQTTPLMATLANMDVFTVRARVPESNVLRIRSGQRASFSTLGLGNQRYDGVVRVIQPVPERIGGAVFFNVLFEVDNKSRTLLSDMTVLVRIETGDRRNVLTIPIIALGERGDDGLYPVRVANDAGESVERRIRIGLQDDARVEVLDGLEEGVRVFLAPAPVASARRVS
jgi:macrolide-specific efflux system membrane fusion protein